MIAASVFSEHRGATNGPVYRSDRVHWPVQVIELAPVSAPFHLTARHSDRRRCWLAIWSQWSPGLWPLSLSMLLLLSVSLLLLLLLLSLNSWLSYLDCDSSTQFRQWPRSAMYSTAAHCSRAIAPPKAPAGPHWPRGDPMAPSRWSARCLV